MRTITFLFLACLSLSSVAMSSDYCFDDAAEKNGINKDILVAIAMVESNMQKNAVNKNRNGTEDIGVMQINSIHFPLLKSAGIQRQDLFNACVNIHVSALILKDCIRVFGNTWTAVGAYHTGNSKGKKIDRQRQAYALKVWTRYRQIKGSA